MVPPVYSDLGALARGLFNRNYHRGIWQLECTTKTSSGVEFFTTDMTNQDLNKIAGSLQTRYKIKDFNLTLTERWNTANWLYGDIMQRDKLAKGLMLGFEGNYQPPTGKKDGKFKLGYARKSYNFLSDISLHTNPIMNASIVLGHKEILGGLSFHYDSGGANLPVWSAALGWANKYLELHGELIDNDNWLATAFCKVHKKIDVALQFSKDGGAIKKRDDVGDIAFGAGLIFHLYDETLIRAKVFNDVHIGLGFQKKLLRGLTFSISTMIDGKNLQDGGHKFGIGIAIDS